MKLQLVVVGYGMAGTRAVEEILNRQGKDVFDITVFGEEPPGSYDRRLLTSVLAGAQAPESAVVSLPARHSEGLMFMTGERVCAVDRRLRRVRGNLGSEVGYDAMVIATGSRPYVPPIANLRGEEGRLRQGVHTFHTLADCRAVAAAARSARSVAVLGGGLLGLETARALLNYGCAVHLVHIADRVANAQLDETASRLLEAAMRRMGVEIHLGKTAAFIEGSERVEALVFKDGSRLSCDLLVITAGTEPNTELGWAAGLTVERGLVVDNHMQCIDDANVYALGDCAQHRGTVYGRVQPLWDQARVLADCLTGWNTSASYHGSRVTTNLCLSGVEVTSMGNVDSIEQDDEVVSAFTGPGVYRRLVLRKGRLAGAVLVGDLGKTAWLAQAFEKNAPIPRERLHELLGGGASRPGVALHVAAEPPALLSG